MPAVSERQRRFMGAELGRLRRGEQTSTGMSATQLRDYAKKKKKVTAGTQAEALRPRRT